MWKVIDKLGIPTLDLSKRPSPQEILQFLHNINRFLRGDETSDGAVLQQALKGDREREWGAESGYDFQEIKKKKPGQYRLVVDNRLVNADCKPVGAISASPLAIIKMMRGAKIFTTLDCKNAFYSLELAEKDRALTAISPPGIPRLELTRMPMGAKASMAALYQAMVSTLGEALYRDALVWADDIIIFSQNMEEHLEHVDSILKKLDENGFCISRSKVELGKKEVKWLGYTISADGVRPDHDKVEELLKMRRPETLKELRSALGM